MNDNAYSLLKSNLETMYSQTEQWIEDIEFYEEELSVLKSLISYRINATESIDLKHRLIFKNIEDLLYKLSEDIISQIRNHRQELKRLIDLNNIEENHEESKKHIVLLEKMDNLKHGIKKLKKALFRYVKDHPLDFDFDYETVFKDL